MSQHDFDIANQGFPATRADINNAFQAIASNSSGPTAPSTTYANMWWYDTTNDKMYLRNAADSAWIEVAVIDQTNGEWQITTGVVQAKDSDGLALKTDDGTTRLFIKDSDGFIGKGTTSPASGFHVSDGTSIGSPQNANRKATVTIEAGSEGSADLQFLNASYNHIFFGDAADANIGYQLYDHTNNSMQFGVNAAERMRIDSSGNLLVGKTSTAFGTAGANITSAGSAEFTRNSVVMNLNRISSDGEILRFYKDGSTVGSISFFSGGCAFVGNSSNPTGIQTNGDNIIPTTLNSLSDNAKDLGHPSYRWDDVFATNGTIQTSDRNEKQQIASLTDAEITAAKAISKLFKTFKWNDSVAEKGDAARTHSGVIAQEVEQAMTDAGLNAGDYAFFISTTWWETQTEVPAVEADEENGVEAQEAYTRTDTYETAEEAPEGATERNRKGIRYPQLLSFIGAATEQRLASIESRLDALEA